jgi:hypothetical protein
VRQNTFGFLKNRCTFAALFENRRIGKKEMKKFVPNLGNVVLLKYGRK